MVESAVQFIVHALVEAIGSQPLFAFLDISALEVISA